MLSISEQIFTLIQKSNNILIVLGGQASPDAICSGLALYLFFKKIDKNTQLIGNSSHESCGKLDFLPSFREIENASKIKTDYDLIIVLDAPDLESLGEIYENNFKLFYNTPILNIDHKARNERFGEINLVELKRSSVSEILFALIYADFRSLLDSSIATCLLAGIINKTRNFKTLNVTDRALGCAARLINLGAQREKIVKNFFICRDLELMKIWGSILENLRGEAGNKLIWFSLDDINPRQKERDVEFIIKEAIIEFIEKISNAELAIAFYICQKEGKKTSKALMRAIKNVNVLDLVKGKAWKPIGGSKTVFLESDLKLEDFQDKVLAEIMEKILVLKYRIGQP